MGAVVVMAFLLFALAFGVSIPLYYIGKWFDRTERKYVKMRSRKMEDVE
jgi:hypothetical protein